MPILSKIKKNLEVHKFLWSVFATGVAAIWTVFLYLHQTDKPQINTGNITNSNVKIEQHITNGPSIEQYVEDLKKSREDLIKEKDKSHIAELKLVENKFYDLNKSYLESLEANRKLHEQLEKINNNSLNISKQNIQQAQAALDKGDLSKADEIFAKIIDESEKSTSLTANAYFQRAVIAYNTYKWEEAVRFANDAIRFDNNNAEYLTFLGILYQQKENYANAENCLMSALKLNLKQHGEKSLESANTYNNLAMLYAKTYQQTYAQSMLLKAIKIVESLSLDSTKTYPHLGNYYSNLSLIYKDQAKYNDALLNQLKAIAVHEKTLPANHSDLAIDYNNLGGIYVSQKNFAMAGKYFLKAVAIDESNMPRSGIALARHSQNLASAYLEQGLYLKAKSILLKVLSLQKKYPSILQSDLGLTYFNLALTHSLMGQEKLAEPFYSQAADIAMTSFGINDPRTKDILDMYLICLHKQGKDTDQFLKKYGLKKITSQAY